MYIMCVLFYLVIYKSLNKSNYKLILFTIKYKLIKCIITILHEKLPPSSIYLVSYCIGLQLIISIIA